MLQGKAGARTHLNFIAIGNGKGETSCNGVAFAGMQSQAFGGGNVHARRA